MRRSIKRSIKSDIKVQITGGTEVASFAVSNQSISRGALTLTGAAAHTFTASTGTINSIGTVTGLNAADWDISYSSNTVTCSPSGDGLANGPYSLTIPCYPEAAQGGTPVNVTLTCTTTADTYTVGNEAQYSTAITDIGTASSGNVNVELLEGVYIWDNSNLNNKTFNNLVTVKAANNKLSSFTGSRIGVAAEAEIRSPNNIRFENLTFNGYFDPSVHSFTTAILKIKNTLTDVSFVNCDFNGNLTTLGPSSGGFHGALGYDGTTNLVGDWLVEDCKVSACMRGLNFGCGSGFTNTGRFVVRDNEIVDCGSDGIVLNGPSDNHIIEDNYLHNFYNDPWNIQILLNAYLRRPSLLGAADSQRFTYYCRHKFGAAGSQETIYEQGSALRLYRDTTGNIHCDIDDTGGTQRISMASAGTVGYEIVDLLVSVDTTGTSRMYIQRQSTDGSGAWTEESSQIASSETLDLTAANVSWLSTYAGGEYISGNTITHMAWHGIAPDITLSSTRDQFAGAFNDRVTPSSIFTNFGAPIVAFYGFNSDLDAGTNNGTGGDFTKPQGEFDNAHGDYVQGIPGAFRDVENWTVRRNIGVPGRSDSSPFTYLYNQGLFFEDIADGSNQYNYVNCNIYDNCVLVYNTVHGISIYNAENCAVYNNTIAYPPSVKLTGGLVPQINVLSENGGVGSGNIVNDNILPASVNIASGFGSSSNNIVSNDTTAGVNSWSNLFDGQSFEVFTKADALAAFNAKAGGPLLTADPDIGAIGTAYTDWVNQTSTVRYSDTTPPTLSGATSTQDGSAGWSGSVTTDEDNGTLYAIATVNNSAPSAIQIVAGQDGTGAAAASSISQAVSSTGVQNVSDTGLSSSTQYYVWYMHRDSAGNNSLITSAGSFTTDSGLVNLLSDSNDFNGASWTTVGSVIITSNNTTDPDGGMTADEIDDTTTSVISGKRQDITISADSQNYIFSAYVKASTASNVNLEFRLLGGTSVWNIASFDLSTGTVGSTFGTPQASITDVGSGWYRISVVATNNGTNTTLRAAVAASATGPFDTNSTGSSFWYEALAEAKSGTTPSSYP